MSRQISFKPEPSSHFERNSPAGGGEEKHSRRAAAAGRANSPFPELFAGARRRGFALLIAAGLGQGAALAAMALLMKSGLDRAFAGAVSGASGQNYFLFAFLGLCAFAAGALKWFAHIEAERIGQSYAHALRMRLFRRLVAAGAQPKGKRGAVLLRLSGDLTPLRLWVSRGLAQLIVSGLTMAMAVAALASINWRIAIAVAITLGAAAAASMAISGRLGDKTAGARRERGKLANRAAAVIDDGEAARERKAARDERRRLRRLSRGVRDALLERAYYTGALRAIAESGGAFAGIAAMAVGIGLTTGAALGPGSVMSAVFVAGVLAPHAHAASRSLEYWTASVVARKKQIELFKRLSREAK